MRKLNVFTGPGPKFVFTSPDPQFVFTGPGSNFLFTRLGQSKAWACRYQPCPPNLYLLALAYGFYYRALNLHLPSYRVFVFPGPRPFAWPPALALASGPGSKFVFTGPGSQFVFTDAGTKFVFTSPGTKFVFTGPGTKFVFTGSTRPEFAHTDLVSPVSIYWPWSMICTHTGC